MDHPPLLYRVLIVDDSPSVREALRWALEDEIDLQVVGEASDGVMALARVAELEPDIALLDIEMPGLDGFAVARQIKTLAHPPLIIFLSVHGDALMRQRGASAGGDGFAEKGIGWAALVDQLRSTLRAHH